MSALWIAFYSVRGGVGRSTTLALTALDLARRGHRVAVLDFDLESPGLDVLLTGEGKDEHAPPRVGVVDFLDARLHGRKLDVEDIILPRDLPGEYTGRLFLVPAGSCDSSYLSALDRLDLAQMYERSGLLNPVRALRAELEEALDPDVVLVDSRTGYSDAAFVTLFDLADAVVVVLVPDLQNVMRLAPVLKRLVKAPRSPQILLVANKCQMSLPALRAIANVEEMLRKLVPAGKDEDEEERLFLHRIVFDSSFTWMQRLMPPPVLADAQQKLGERLHEMVRERTQPSPAIAPRSFVDVIEDRRERLLGRLDFGDETAETDKGLLDAFLFSSRVTEALRPERWLVRGRKGAGKSSVFRMLTERPDESRKHCSDLKDWRVVAAHGDTWTDRKYLSAEDLRLVHKLIGEEKASWRDFWRMYAVAQAARSIPSLANTELRRKAAQLLDVPVEERADHLEKLLTAGAHTWVGEMQRLVDQEGQERPGLLFVYDHLDAGFGSEIKDFSLRREAVTGLLDAWTADIDPSRLRLLPKVFLREDVFASLSLANVNRWRARDVELRWDFANLAKCLSRRASNDQELREYLREHAKELEHIHPPEARSFVVLFDERVRPWERQARTWLTASNRLTDVNGNLFPRDFVRLGIEALKLERLDPRKRRYFEPALIAGEHMLAALPKVSELRVQDLKEEFLDYKPLLDSLQGLRSPFYEAELRDHFIGTGPRDSSGKGREGLVEEALVRLKEHGVIGDFWDGRLFIPDLYLRGLGMSRAGW